MALLLKTVRSLIRNPRPPSRSCCPCCSDSTPLPFFLLSPASPLPPLLPSSSPLSTNPFFSFISPLTSSHPPLRRWTPFPGPLFLSLPPWKLSQSATPLYLRGKEAIFPKDLPRVTRYPIESVAVVGVGGGVVGLEPTRIPPGRRDGEPPGMLAEDRFLNLPNLVSISRMASGPLIGWMIMNEWYLPAFCGLVISGATDWLDGFLARKMNIKSVFGSYLDPLADKVLIGCVALAMVENGLLHSGLVSLVVLRDVGLVGGAIYRRAASLGWEWKTWSDFFNLDAMQREKVEPLLISKVNTVFQLLLVAAALLQPEFGSEHTQLYITYLSWLVASTTTASAVAYGVHLRNSSASTVGKQWSRRKSS